MPSSSLKYLGGKLHRFQACLFNNFVKFLVLAMFLNPQEGATICLIPRVAHDHTTPWTVFKE